jgi:hypothetical protein
MNLKRRKKNSALICSCCDMPCAIVENGRLVWQSRHGHSSHSNALSLDDLKEIVRILEEGEAIKGKETELTDSPHLIC